MNKERTKSYLLVIIAMLFWGMSFVWSKIVFNYYGPLTTIFVRLVISSAILTGIWYFFYKAEKIQPADRMLLLVSAFFSPFCYFIGENFGLIEVSSTIASVIIATIPVFTPFAARIFLKERLSWLNFAGMFVSFTGVIIMLLTKDFGLNASLRGLLLLGFAVVAALGYGITVRRLSVKYSAVTIVTFQNITGTILFLPFFLFFDMDAFLKVSLNTELVISILCLAVFASSGAFILFTASIKHLGISRANIFSNLIPVFTAIFSFIMLNEQFSVAKLFGMILVITGVVLAQKQKISFTFKQGKNL